MTGRDDGKRVCLLTGASGRLGTAFCRAYAGRYSIVAVHRDRLPAFPSQHMTYVDPLDLTADLPANTHAVWAVRADLRDPDAAERVVEAALTRYGQVDLLLNAAAASVWSPVLGSSTVLDSLEDQFAVNVAAPLRLARALCRASWQVDDRTNRLRNRSIINVSSTAGVHVYPGQGQSVYAASKAALNQASRHLAAELAVLGVRVNAVAPNSFPGVVGVDEVLRTIVDVDEGDLTGEVVVLDADGVYAVG